MAKLWEGVKVWIWNTINGWVDDWIGSEIEVDDTGIELKKKQQVKTDETEEQILDAEVVAASETENTKPVSDAETVADNLETYKRPVDKPVAEPVSKTLSFDSQNDTLIEKKVSIETLLSKNFLDNVRNHYKAGRGIGKRGAKQETRDRNLKKYLSEKKMLELVGVKITELERTVKFDITAVKKG